ncbi:transglycosylase family protein [Staphylococcus gallinarum]|uniref:Transglycosylase n=1 Tax=Staphylococcus gallinarum TaxID=1293 RepID=A0A2T4SUK6_STAGA|nr:transglycosylase family protein [Staphylococcus gallinarum]MCD8822217.1 transglycosylase family protein [Staphylococcus gallinarum]MCD8827683.1 transglycosylase family protein [Staphylococcus gallinarum]MCQ9289746.1 transglycosylase family protein [Staphylococcus gallinarum]PTE76667.1 transglycosylase [Staphylococcus gallinarum]PTL08280.1 transglycosylase [Staphylococcus gallinarum]
MKKTVIASTLAVGLGVTGVAAGNSADASEQGVNKAELAQLAQSNPQQLNESPVHEGSYNYNFNLNGVNYNFESNGETWSWSYGEGASNNNSGSTEVEQPQQQTTTQTEQPAQEAAPQTEQTQQPQQEATTQQASTQQSSNSSSSEESTGSSVNVNSHLQQIAQRESGGDLKAVNPSSGAAGKYQFLQSTWDSVAPDEYKGVSPTEAPESVQDAAAVKLYNTAGASQWVTA